MRCAALLAFLALCSCRIGDQSLHDAKIDRLALAYIQLQGPLDTIDLVRGYQISSGCDWRVYTESREFTGWDKNGHRAAGVVCGTDKGFTSMTIEQADGPAGSVPLMVAVMLAIMGAVRLAVLKYEVE